MRVKKKSINQIQFFSQAHDQQRDLHHLQKQLGKAAQECEELSQHSGKSLLDNTPNFSILFEFRNKTKKIRETKYLI